MLINSPINNRLTRLEQSAAASGPAPEWRIVRQIVEADGTLAETLERDSAGQWVACKMDSASAVS